jgi:hypothetical protein
MAPLLDEGGRPMVTLAAPIGAFGSGLRNAPLARDCSTWRERRVRGRKSLSMSQIIAAVASPVRVRDVFPVAVVDYAKRNMARHQLIR